MAAFALDEAVAILERTPSVLRAWLAELDEAWLVADEGPDTFSPKEVVGHLLHGEEADWIPRARMILEHGEARTFEPFDRFAQRALLARHSAEALLERFAAARTGSLETLRGWRLSAAQLALRGRHPAFGPVTLGQLLSTWAVHDLGHVAQIARVMAKRYAEEVGPWREYLPVLRDRTRSVAP